MATSVGHILLQPQKLQRVRHRDPASAVLDDLVAFAMLLAADGNEDGGIFPALARGGENAVLALIGKASGGAASAIGRFETMFEPLFAQLQTVTQLGTDDAAAAMDLMLGMFSKAVGWLRDLSIADVRQKLQSVFDIVEQDLGFTPDFLQQWIWLGFDKMILALGEPMPGETPIQRSRRKEAAGILQRIGKEAQLGFVFPRLDADRAAQTLVTLLKTPEIDQALARVACVSQSAGSAFHLGRSVIDLLESAPTAPALNAPFEMSFSAPATLPPVKVGYYASKLLTTQNWDGDWGELPAAVEADLVDGLVTSNVRDGFRNLGIVLSRTAYLLIQEAAKEWKVIDRKQYIVKKENQTLIVFRLVKFGHSEFVSAATGDMSQLRKLFKENGIPLADDTVGVVHVEGSSSWEITDGGGGHRFQGSLFEGDITIYPLNRASLLFEIPIALENDFIHKEFSAAVASAFNDNGVPLSARTRISSRPDSDQWDLDDGDFEYKIAKDDGKLQVGTGGFWGWLFSTVGYPQAEKVWVNQERTQVMLGHQIIHAGTNVDWQNAPAFNPGQGNKFYSFANLPPASIEKWTYVLSWLQDYLNSAIYIAKIGIAADKDEVGYSITSNSLNIARSISEGTAKLAKDRSIGDLIGIDSQTWLFDWGWWYDFLVDVGIKAVGGIEGAAKPSAPDDPNVNGFSKFVDKVLSAVLGTEWVDTSWIGTTSDALLSFLTLYNHKEPAGATESRPENYKENGAFVKPFWNVSLLIYCASIPDDEYALPFQTLNLTLYYWILGVLGVGTVSGFLGWLIGQCVVAKAGFGTDPGQTAKTIVKAAGMSELYFFPFLKLVKGKT